jgi:hypothetical protein
VLDRFKVICVALIKSNYEYNLVARNNRTLTIGDFNKLEHVDKKFTKCVIITLIIVVTKIRFLNI